MTFGKSIQSHRKRLGLSQEELGRKLLVSRQTISLWEKDQTVPTVDNLIRLKDIFSVSFDDILNFESNKKLEEIQPNEIYQFNYSEPELNEIFRYQQKVILKKPVTNAVFSVLLIIFFIFSHTPDFMTGISIGFFVSAFVSIVKGVISYGKAQKSSIKSVLKSTYEYKIFENYIIINIYRNEEKCLEMRCCFTDIERIVILKNWFLLQLCGRTFILRKSDLKENSAFYSYMYKNPNKTVENALTDRRRTISILLFVASLFSILGAIVLVGAVSSINGKFTENMWLFFLMTPIPIASTIYGFILKSKGYRCKKNIIAGIIMTFFLCVYGSFIFMS